MTDTNLHSSAEDSYKETIDFLFSQFPQYQNVGAKAYKPGLEGMEILDNYYNHPHKTFKTIHIAGTNGKGSTSHILASAMQMAGYKVGLYTSPHLIDFRERIKVNGEVITQEAVVEFVKKFRQLFGGSNLSANKTMTEGQRALLMTGWKPSFFEITTAMAFDWFSKCAVDVAVIETGLGGRLDSTNIITPMVSVITSIGFDHCEHLGYTLPEIAGEKAGIIKPSVPVVIGEFNASTLPVFEAKATEMGSALVEAYKEYDCDSEYITSLNKQMDLQGAFQEKNLCTVLSVLDLLQQMRIPDERILCRENLLRGIKCAASLTGLHGRWEHFTTSSGIRIIADTAHNAHGLKYLLPQLAKEHYSRLFVVLGVVKEKDLDSVLPLLPREAHYLFTQAAVERALPASALMERCCACGNPLQGEVCVGVVEALESAVAMASCDDLIFVGGSNFVVGEALPLLLSLCR